MRLIRQPSEILSTRREAISALMRDLDYRDPLRAALSAAESIVSVQMLDAYAVEKAAREAAARRAAREAEHETAIYAVRA